MTPEQFAEVVQMLRSSDPMTYEEGYHLLQGDDLIQYAPQVVELLQPEADPGMRARFVELVGDADLDENIPHLVHELSHADRTVRSWAYNQLSRSRHDSARARAEEYRQSRPGEDFY